MILKVDISMRDYGQWCLIVLFFASTVFSLCMSFLWMRKGKPARWKNGYTIVRVLGIVEIALLIAAIVFVLCRDFSMVQIFVSIAYLAASVNSVIFVPKRKDIEY